MKNLLILLQDMNVVNQPVPSDKYGVVIAIISVLFAGIVVYLITLDKKIKKLEK